MKTTDEKLLGEILAKRRYRIDEVARQLGKSERTVRRLIIVRNVTVVYIGRTPMIPASEVQKILRVRE